jgi:hypothetical protein
MVAETRYMRSDSHVINGLDALKLLTSNTSSMVDGTTAASGNLTLYWGIRVWVRHADESEDEITSGTPVAQVSRAAVGSGMQSNTWDCPETALNNTDAIVVRVYIKFSDWWLAGFFITNQAQNWDSPTQLDSATWTVHYHTERTYDSKLNMTGGHFRYGHVDTHNSRIENYTWSEGGAPPAVVLRRLLVGVGL